jgi:DNA-binding CsgD family transcriptional regulator
LLILRRTGDRPRLPQSSLNRLFGLTPAEAGLASRLASGESLASAADALGMAKETARVHLRAVFTKTDTHRQAELVSLLATLARRH